MTPEERELLNRSVELGEENNKMLHSIKRSMFMARLMSWLYWLIIIGVSIGAFYYIEPYLNKMMDLYNSVSNTQQKINNTGLEDLLKKFSN